jgi:hypothetical protein
MCLDPLSSSWFHRRARVAIVIEGDHSAGGLYPDDDSFLLLSGIVQALEQGKDGFEEVTMNAGDFRHVPQEVRYAWKNQINELAVAVIVTTSRLGRFFQEVGRPIAADTSKASISCGYSALRGRHCSLPFLVRQPEGNAAVRINLWG